MAEYAVSCKLLTNEGVVWFVLIECFYDIVTITIGIGKRHIFIQPVRIGVSNDVKPMPPPALAVLRAGEQAVDQLFPRIRGFVVEKCLDFFRRWRQTDQVECDPSYQGAAICGRCGFQPLCPQLCKDEAIDRADTPAVVF